MRRNCRCCCFRFVSSGSKIVAVVRRFRNLSRSSGISFGQIWAFDSCSSVAIRSAVLVCVSFILCWIKMRSNKNKRSYRSYILFNILSTRIRIVNRHKRKNFLKCQKLWISLFFCQKNAAPDHQWRVLARKCNDSICVSH